MSSEGPAISVALVEDDPGTRERLARALAASPRLTLAYAAANARDIFAWLAANSVDVLLVDLGLPDRSGLEVIRHCQAAAPATEVMVVTMFGDEAHMIAAFEAGARGYLLKDGTEEDLARHVMSLHAGGSPMTPLIARQLLERFSPPPAPAPGRPAPGPADTMTEREREILLVLSRGYTYAEAARLLGIAPSTVQSHVKNIYSKLAVRSKTEAIFEARQMGLL
jgi:DNA-binding NarL/FixJ family response regulator